MSEDYEIEPIFGSIEEANEAASVGGMKVEPTWECPECSGGFMEDPHRFLNHLETDHGYTQKEASNHL